MTDLERAKSKLKKLLALAASENEHEASLAMERAEEIMAKFRLRTIDVAEDGSGAYVDTRVIYGLGKTAATWEGSLGWAVSKAFDGRAIRTRERDGWKFTFIAAKTDLEIIADLYERIRATVVRMSKAYVKAEKDWTHVSPRTLHNSYRLGMVGTIGRRLADLSANRTPVEAVPGCRDLMVVKDKAVEIRTNKMFPKLKTARAPKSDIAFDAHLAGARDGSNVSLHRSVPGAGSSTMIGR